MYIIKAVFSSKPKFHRQNVGRESLLKMMSSFGHNIIVVVVIHSSPAAKQRHKYFCNSGSNGLNLKYFKAEIKKRKHSYVLQLPQVTPTLSPSVPPVTLGWETNVMFLPRVLKSADLTRLAEVT